MEATENHGPSHFKDVRGVTCIPQGNVAIHPSANPAGLMPVPAMILPFGLMELATTSRHSAKPVTPLSARYVANLTMLVSGVQTNASSGGIHPLDPTTTLPSSLTA